MFHSSSVIIPWNTLNEVTAITRRHTTPLQKLSILKKKKKSEPGITQRTDQSLTHQNAHQNAHQNSIPLSFLILNKDPMGTSAYCSYSQDKGKNGKEKFLLKLHSFVPCQFSILSLTKHCRILHVFKDQYLWKTILAYREETENYTTFNPLFCPVQNQNQQQITNCGGLNSIISLLSFEVGVKTLL